MGKIGHGIGSEWHLLRHLGYHRGYLSEKVLEVLPGDSIEWLDFKFTHVDKKLGLDHEFDGLEFIEDVDVLKQWKAFWPGSGRAQNWDAVARLAHGSKHDWVLVEAKGHLGELKSECGAEKPESKRQIEAALTKTIQAVCKPGVPVEHWLAPYYQMANRLAALHFLNDVCRPVVPARLLYIYFYGDTREDADCPQNVAGWVDALDEMTNWLGLDSSRPLFERVYRLFLPVSPIIKDNKT